MKEEKLTEKSKTSAGAGNVIKFTPPKIPSKRRAKLKYQKQQELKEHRTQFNPKQKNNTDAPPEE